MRGIFGYTSRDMKKALIVAGFVVLAGLVFAAGLWFTLVSAVRGGVVTVPDVTGVPMTVAQRRLEQAGLHGTAGETQTVYSDFVKLGGVAIQDPAAGSLVKPARVVDLVLSRGSKREVIPDLTGLTLSDAAEMISKYQLRLTGVARAFDRRPQGTVVSQAPTPGSSGIVDNRVKLLVSRGDKPRQLLMPDFRGQLLVSVEKDLTHRGIRFVVKTFANQIEDENVLFVKDQYPLPGFKALTEQTVTLQVVEREAF
ncbi:MAG: PASTA domain-containing protein [Acidobacteria bacterium]|nr:PASTA domain-containing protein [Acidobacteriota bacterium]